MTDPYHIDFRVPKTAKELAEYIGISFSGLEKILTSETRAEFYQKHSIAKRSIHRILERREVWEAHGMLSHAHKSIARRFELFARSANSQFPHEAAYGYVRHRGTKGNASIHCNAPLLLKADISNFFPSISVQRLIEKFNQLGMHPEAAIALAKFLTINDCLPLGLNASPMLANLVCLDLDKKIQILADQYGCKYTRYADDISISGAAVPSRVELKKIIEGEGFRFSERKGGVTKRGQSHYVTGLSISESIPHAPRRMKRRLRQELYYCKKFGIEDHLRRFEWRIQQGINRLDGTVRYISYIEPNAAALKSEWNKLQIRDGVSTSYESLAMLNKHDHAACYIDESEFAFRGKSFLALGLVFTDQGAEISCSTIATLRDHQVDPFAAGNKGALEKEGLHFVPSHPDLRTAYIKQLSNYAYRAFVIYAELKSPDKYRETYISLLSRILPHRLMFYDGAEMQIIFEENSKIKTPAMKDAVKDAYDSLEKINSRRPYKCPEVLVGKKMDYPCFSIPDYLLAIFGRYAQFNEKIEEKSREHQFERLRDKYRLIIDADNNVEYSRRYPFTPFAITGDLVCANLE